MPPQPTPEPPASQLEIVSAIEQLHESVRELGAATRGGPAGSSYLTVPVPTALPKPPDVAAEGKVPGGQLIPCTPTSGTLITRTELLLQLPFPHGYQSTVRRIHLALPIFLEEAAVTEQPTESET